METRVRFSYAYKVGGNDLCEVKTLSLILFGGIHEPD
jgi:hypothetical protein